MYCPKCRSMLQEVQFQDDTYHCGPCAKAYRIRLVRAMAVRNHRVEIIGSDVWVDGDQVKTDKELKICLGLRGDVKYPTPDGKIEDWATLEEIRKEHKNET